MSADKRDLILDGKTAAGVQVRVECNPETGPYEPPALVTVDGVDVTPEMYSVLRDGGTLVIQTALGEIVVPSKLRGGEPTLNGETIL